MEFVKYFHNGKTTWRLLLRAFNYRNYRLYFLGQSLSLLGTWMQHTATSWLVYRMTDSVLLLGLTGFAGQIPSFLLTPVAGVLADRMERRRLLLVTQFLAMLQALLMAVLVLLGVAQVWHIIFLTFLLGIINAFDVPARHSFVVDMVDHREDLGNAVALNSSMFHGSRLVGPALAGILIGRYGEEVCFIINTISFMAVILCLLAMKTRPRSRSGAEKPVSTDLREGICYAFESVQIKHVLILIALISLVGMPYTVFMPVFARDILGGGPQTLGLLMASSGLGAFAGTVFLAARRDFDGLEKVINGAAILFFFGVVFFALSKVLWLSLICLMIAGFGIVLQVASGNTMLQAIVEEDKRGRIMSLFNMAFMGMAPIGSLLAGGVAAKVGVNATLLLCATAGLVGTMIISPRLRPPQVRKTGAVDPLSN